MLSDVISSRSSLSSQTGLTLIELVVVLTIVGVLFTLTSINLTPLVPRANVTNAADQLVADLKQQQMKAMVGVAPDASSSATHGVYFDSQQYILFSGSTYLATDSANFALDLSGDTTISTSIVGNQIVFAPGSGEIVGSTGVQTITLQDLNGGQTRTITINELGVVEEIN